MNNKFPNSPSPNFQSSGHSPALPPGWTWTTLGQIAVDLIGGGTPSREVPEYFGGNIPWFTPTEVPKDRVCVLYSSRENITDLGFKKSSARIIPAGSVMLTSRASIGYVGIAGTDVTTNQGFASIVCPEGLFNSYLAYWLWSIRDELESKATGTTFKEISKAKLREFCFPLPPLAEQRRIVAKIEELFSKLDAGVEALKKVKAGLKRYRQSVLKHAFEGRLTEDYRRRKSKVGVPADDQGGEGTRMAAEPRVEYGAEDASALLARIREERKKALGRKYKELPPIDTSDLPALPEGWAWARMSEACTKVQDGTHFSPKVQYSEPGHHLFKYITAKNIRPFRLDLNDLTYIDESVHKRIYARCNPEQGDVLLTKDGVNTGMVAVNTLEEEFSVLSSIALLKPNRDVLTGKYLCYFIGSPIGQRLILGRMTGTAIKRIILERARNAEVPIAPIDEQQEIVSEIERRFSIADAVEKVVDESHKQAERLRQSILKRAFEGKLVPQDPSDEPAEVLLERIRAEKEKNQTPKRSSRNKIRSTRVRASRHG